MTCRFNPTSAVPWALLTIEHTYVTRHHRPTLCNIAIYHTLLDFRLGENRG